eukprot:403348769
MKQLKQKQKIANSSQKYRVIDLDRNKQQKIQSFIGSKQTQKSSPGKDNSKDNPFMQINVYSNHNISINDSHIIINSPNYVNAKVGQQQIQSAVGKNQKNMLLMPCNRVAQQQQQQQLLQQANKKSNNQNNKTPPLQNQKQGTNVMSDNRQVYDGDQWGSNSQLTNKGSYNDGGKQISNIRQNAISDRSHHQSTNQNQNEKYKNNW